MKDFLHVVAVGSGATASVSPIAIMSVIAAPIIATPAIAPVMSALVVISPHAIVVPAARIAVPIAAAPIVIPPVIAVSAVSPAIVIAPIIIVTITIALTMAPSITSWRRGAASRIKAPRATETARRCAAVHV